LHHNKEVPRTAAGVCSLERISWLRLTHDVCTAMTWSFLTGTTALWIKLLVIVWFKTYRISGKLSKRGNLFALLCRRSSKLRTFHKNKNYTANGRRNKARYFKAWFRTRGPSYFLCGWRPRL